MANVIPQIMKSKFQINVLVERRWHAFQRKGYFRQAKRENKHRTKQKKSRETKSDTHMLFWLFQSRA